MCCKSDLYPYVASAHDTAPRHSKHKRPSTHNLSKKFFFILFVLYSKRQYTETHAKKPYDCRVVGRVCACISAFVWRQSKVFGFDCEKTIDRSCVCVFSKINLFNWSYSRNSTVFFLHYSFRFNLLLSRHFPYLLRVAVSLPFTIETTNLYHITHMHSGGNSLL